MIEIVIEFFKECLRVVFSLIYMGFIFGTVIALFIGFCSFSIGFSRKTIQK